MLLFSKELEGFQLIDIHGKPPAFDNANYGTSLINEQFAGLKDLLF